MRTLLSILRNIGLVVGFFAAGALTTILIWVIASFASAEPFAIDSLPFVSMAAGAIGPVLSWLLLWRLTRRNRPNLRRALRLTGTLGFALVLAVELPYLVILGIVTLAYHGVRM